MSLRNAAGLAAWFARPTARPRACPPVTILLLASLLSVVSWASPARAADPRAWTTFLRVRSFTDLIATRDTVWAATGEGGLLIYDRAESSWSTVHRQPGGVASNDLSALAFDPSGRLWVGTLGAGVSRLAADRQSWDLVNTFDGLPIDSVTVLESVGDSMWIGTTRGVALWNGHEVSGSLPDVNTVSFDTTFRIPTITGVVQLGDSVWLSSPRGVGFARRSSGLTDWRPVNQGLPSIEIRGLASDGGDLFALSQSGAYRLGPGGWVFTGAVTGFVSRLTDDAGVVLVAGQNGVFRWAGGWVAIPGSPRAFPAQVEPALAPDGVAFAGFRDTLYRQEPGPWTASGAPEGPPGNALLNVDVDGDRVYVTTFSDGVGRFDGVRWRHWPPAACPGGNCDTTFRNTSFAFALLVDSQHRKWVSCWSTSITRFTDDDSPPSFTHFFVPGGLAIERHTWAKAAAEDSAGGVWFGMDTNCKGCSDAQDPIGLEYYNADGSYAANFNPLNSTMKGELVHAVARSRNGRMWVGTDGLGAYYFTLPADSNAFIHLSNTAGQHGVVRGIAAYDAVDSVWMLTPSALLRFSNRATSSSVPLPFTHPGGVSDAATQPIDVAADGTVWVGTDAGVLAYHPRGPLEIFHTGNSALASNNVRAVRVDQATGAVWFATAAGLSRYQPGYQPPAPPSIARLNIRVYPNPITLNGLGFQLRLKGDAAAYQGQVYDLSGRRVHEFAVPANGRVIWDGRDQDGRLVKPGIYFVRALGSGREATVRVVLLQ